jgi:hypothetical protein
MNIDQVIAREAIRYTIGVYNKAVDSGTYEDLPNAFLEGATMNVQGNIVLDGLPAIIDALKAGAARRAAAEPGNFQRHNMTSSMIDLIDGETAVSRHYIMVVTELGFDHSGIYDDRFRRRGDRWFIEHRSACMEWARPDSRFVRWLGAAKASGPGGVPSSPE